MPASAPVITVTVHSIAVRPLRRLWASLLLFEAAMRLALDAGQKAVVAEWSADALGGAQAFEFIRFRFQVEKIGEARKPLAHSLARREPVVPATQIRAHAGPAPVLRAFDQARPHRIERHVAQCRREMRLVEHDGAEPPLPEMTAASAPRMNDAGIAPMHGRERAAQAVGIGRHENEMHVVGHQAPGPHFDVRGPATLRQEIAIERIVLGAEKDARPSIAALRDVVRVGRNDDAGKASHAAWCDPPALMSIECTVTVILMLARLTAMYTRDYGEARQLADRAIAL